MKVVVPFYPIDIKGKEDYFKLCADVSKGEILPVLGKSSFSIIKKLFGQNVHVHGRGLPFPELSCFFAKKSVYTPHNNFIGSKLYDKVIRRFIFNNYTRIVAQTEYGKKNYIKDGISSEKIKLLPIPIDYKFWAKSKGGDKFRKKYDISKKEPIALCVNIRKTKNPLVMVEACKKVGIKIVMVGFKDKSEVRKGFEWLLPPKKLLDLAGEEVILTGFIPKGELLAAYDAATVYLNSSEDGGECFTLVVYQAAAAGIPLCLPDFGVFSMFKERALFHNNHDSEQLAKNIIKYLEDPSLRKRNINKAKEVAKKIDYPVVRKQFEKFYKEVGLIE